MDTLFGGPNHVEKGGAQLHIDDAHHAQVGDNEIHTVNSPITKGDKVAVAEHAEIRDGATPAGSIAPAPANKF